MLSFWERLFENKILLNEQHFNMMNNNYKKSWWIKKIKKISNSLPYFNIDSRYLIWKFPEPAFISFRVHVILKLLIKFFYII